MKAIAIKPGGVRQVIKSLLWGTVLATGLLAASSLHNLSQLTPDGPLREEQGTLAQGRGKGEKTHVMGTAAFHCPGGCGYWHVHKDWGKQATVLVDRRGVVFELRVDGEAKLTSGEMRERADHRFRKYLIFFLTFSAAAMLTRQHLRAPRA